jgi:hypothetical protein
MDWQAGMGGFEAQVWAHVEKMRERLAEPEAGQVLLAVVGAR